MEIAQLVVSPAVLLAASFFFWREAKAGRLELETRLVTRMDRMEDRLEKRIAGLDCRMETRIARLEQNLIKPSKAG